MWEYTDGYRLNLSSRIKTDTSVYSAHCLKKTRSKISGAYDSGAICFETKYGALELVSFYGGVNFATTSLKISTSTDMNKWINYMPSSYFGNRNWFVSGNAYKGLLDYYPTYSGATGAENVGSSTYWSLFMPKWQQDDYYSDNFRINKGDSVTMIYKDSTATSSTTDPTSTFVGGGEIYIDNGALSLSTAAGLAFAVAALTF